MKAQENKVYKNIVTDEILGNELWIGCNDKAENYIEIDKPIGEIIPPTETEKTTEEIIAGLNEQVKTLEEVVEDLGMNILLMQNVL